MDTHRWNQIKQVFEEAVALDDDRRTEFLVQACSADPEMLKEVESLLHSHRESRNFLEPPATEELPRADENNSGDYYIGKRFGPYRVERLIGHGGMGAVYEAVRDDGQFLKHVAIKLVRPAASSKDLIQRFHQERQTLALLEHPNIARLLDGGTTEDGIPYLVMEYVAGVPIDDYCDANKLTIAERLRLFRIVCSAVQTAHQNLIVHRDLKPGNILVTADGTPKLLDFGISKLLNETRQSEPSDVTRVGLRFITLEYASPEQIRGERVTTASDVYSLGVLLYKLLTGRSPYQFKSRLPHEITRVICEEEPLKPSTNQLRIHEPSTAEAHETLAELRGVSLERLRRQLSGDLDTIVLKALHKDPQRRYISVEWLSEDIRRHLEGLPVLARPDTVTYRVSKFVRRHAFGVGATMLVLLAILAGTAGVLWQANKVRQEAAKVEQINNFLQEMLASADPTKRGKDVTVAQALDAAVERIDHELVLQPELAGAILQTIGETYTSLGLYDKASTQLAKALRLRRQVFGSTHEEISVTLHSLAYVAQLNGDYAKADSLYQSAIAMHRSVHPDPDRHGVSMMSDYGTLLRERRDTDQAIKYLGEAAEWGRMVYGPESKDYAMALSNFGPALHDKRELAAAESVYRIAIPILKHYLGERHVDVAQAENNLAFVLMERNDIDGAESLFTHSLRIRREMLGDDHPETTVGMVNLAGIMLRRGKVPQAEKLATEAIAVLRKSVDPDNVKLSSALLLCGRALLLQGKPLAAEPLLREALEIRQKFFPPGHYAITVAESELGGALVRQRRYAEAKPILEHAYANLKATFGENHSTTRDAAKHLDELKKGSGR